MSTGGFTSKGLLTEEKILKLSSLTNTDAIEIGKIATTLGKQRKLPIAIQVRIGDWIVFHASLEGSKIENDWWINRKVAVVMLKQHSTMYERVSAEESGADWYKENNLTDETHAIHGGALPLITEDGFKGIQQLPKGARLGVYVAYVYYYALLNKINKTHASIILSERIRIRDSRKYALILKSYVRHQLNLI
jgi:uncharacterized protein (UPF0303 family)